MEVQFVAKMIVYFHLANISGQMKENVLRFKIFLYLQKYNFDAFQLWIKKVRIFLPQIGLQKETHYLKWTSKKSKV